MTPSENRTAHAKMARNAAVERVVGWFGAALRLAIVVVIGLFMLRVVWAIAANTGGGMMPWHY